MTSPLPLKHLCLALSIMIAFAVAGISAPLPKAKSELPGKGEGETAEPAVDLGKAASDAKLAEEAARHRNVSKENLSQIGIAVHNYHAAENRLPADITDKKGKALLSWRVALLPHLDQDKLCKEFKLDEPWDSKHNIQLLEKMPAVYRSPRVKLKGKGNTVYQVFTGPDAVFGRVNPLTLVAITDGTSNTIMAVESSSAVPWTKPGGIPFDRKTALPDFGKAYGKKPLAVMFDGSPSLLDLNIIKAETLNNAIDPADGNVLGQDWRDGTGR
jgi:hypothetical protein